jgi:peptidoglycan/xylan/chitin deacetylase (PgdA/CDA1 family)
MYHYISIPPDNTDIYRKELSVSPDIFRQHMQWLKDNGYTAIPLEQLIYALNIGWPPLPDKPVILTFDDGYTDNYENAYPIIKEMGFTATFFILTDVTDRKAPGYMTWDMLRDMTQNGMSVQVHGREHLDMTNQTQDWLLYHLLGPAQTIEAELGYTPHLIAYPSGKYDENVIAAAQQYGYWGAVTTIFGSHQRKDKIFELERLRISGNMQIEYFAGMIEGAQ